VRCVKVRKEEAEMVRYRLNRKGLVRKDRRIKECDGFVMIPVTESFHASDAPELELTDVDLLGRTTFRDPWKAVQENVDLPEDLRSLVPRKWERLGDVLIVRFPGELDHYEVELARAYAKELKVKAVLREMGVITGVTRRPNLRVLFGSDTETVHPEGNILYKLDPTQVMFASGNFDEKKRMSSLDCRGETVVDMFAGIGYFALPVAKNARARKVIACEINPIAYHYLVENIALNRVQDVIEPVLGDNQDLPGEKIADRILMGYIGTESFLPKALRLIRPGGIIHYHDVAGIEDCPGKLLRAIGRACEGRRFDVIYAHEVKSYGPCTSHMVVDFRVLD
jgi:tRNA wybutosine-synthesizing protein 2